MLHHRALRKGPGGPPVPGQQEVQGFRIVPSKWQKNQQIETVHTEVKDAYMAVALLSDLNYHSYGQIMNDLNKIFRMGGCEYPETLTSD